MLSSSLVSLGWVVRIPPQNTRRPPGATTIAGFPMTAQPVWIGLGAPIAPFGAIAVCSRSMVLGPVLRSHATCSTPSPVRAVETWSMLEPSDAVTCFHAAAGAGAQSATSPMTRRTNRRIGI